MTEKIKPHMSPLKKLQPNKLKKDVKVNTLSSPISMPPLVVELNHELKTTIYNSPIDSVNDQDEQLINIDDFLSYLSQDQSLHNVPSASGNISNLPTPSDTLCPDIELPSISEMSEPLNDCELFDFDQFVESENLDSNCTPFQDDLPDFSDVELCSNNIEHQHHQQQQEELFSIDNAQPDVSDIVSESSLFNPQVLIFTEISDLDAVTPKANVATDTTATTTTITTSTATIAEISESSKQDTFSESNNPPILVDLNFSEMENLPNSENDFSSVPLPNISPKNLILDICPIEEEPNLSIPDLNFDFQEKPESVVATSISDFVFPDDDEVDEDDDEQGDGNWSISEDSSGDDGDDDSSISSSTDNDTEDSDENNSDGHGNDDEDEDNIIIDINDENDGDINEFNNQRNNLSGIDDLCVDEEFNFLDTFLSKNTYSELSPQIFHSPITQSSQSLRNNRLRQVASEINFRPSSPDSDYSPESCASPVLVGDVVDDQIEWDEEYRADDNVLIDREDLELFFFF